MKRMRGISLVEVLVTMAVMGTGLLAVASFQSGLLTNSGTNKARTEALAFAQARIEQFRNYDVDGDLVTDRVEFDDEFVDSNGSYVFDTFDDGQGGSTTTYNGNNANFTRKYKITGGDDVEKAIEVVVEWRNRKDEEQSGALHTEIDWEAPRSAGDLALDGRGPLIPSATGRAHLGEGTLPPGAGTTPNGDGTALYDDGSGDLKLVVDNDIVLTLENACQANGGSCIGFVKIKGRVFIDVANASTPPGEVYVIASDAAFCHRYYIGNGGTAVNVTSSTTTALLTGSNGDYKYYDYTCYLGGGWHGNVGIILAGGISQNDKICMGDPTSNNDWEKPVIAARRAYRGMLYKHDPNNSPDYKEEYTTTDADGNTSVLTRYYSVGIGDSVVLPDPDDVSQKPHDFVLIRLAVSATAGTNCYGVSPSTPGPMARADTDTDNDGNYGDMFAGMPTDWVCLNDANNNYIDDFDGGVYGAESTCAYDPTDLPSELHVISGTVTVSGDEALLSNLSLAELVTSDGPGNCNALTFGYSGGNYTASYSCDIYEWGNGWNGYVEFKPNTELVGCAYPRTTLTAIDTDTSNIDVSCEGGNFVHVEGGLDLPNGSVSLGITITGSPDRPCLIDNATLTYKCTSDIFTTDWTGSVTYTSNKVICDASGGGMHGSSLTINYSNLQPQTITKNLVIKANGGQCP